MIDRERSSYSGSSHFDGASDISLDCCIHISLGRFGEPEVFTLGLSSEFVLLSGIDEPLGNGFWLSGESIGYRCESGTPRGCLGSRLIRRANPASRMDGNVGTCRGAGRCCRMVHHSATVRAARRVLLVHAIPLLTKDPCRPSVVQRASGLRDRHSRSHPRRQHCSTLWGCSV